MFRLREEMQAYRRLRYLPVVMALRLETPWYGLKLEVKIMTRKLCVSRRRGLARHKEGTK